MREADACDRAALRDRILQTLRAHEVELRAAGIDGLTLFGSVARGEARPDSDVDAIVRLNPFSPLGLFAFVGLEQRVSSLLDRPVQLVPEPIEESGFRDRVSQERLNVF